jgi:hypothetical protein
MSREKSQFKKDLEAKAIDNAFALAMGLFLGAIILRLWGIY